MLVAKPIAAVIKVKASVAKAAALAAKKKDSESIDLDEEGNEKGSQPQPFFYEPPASRLLTVSLGQSLAFSLAGGQGQGSSVRPAPFCGYRRSVGSRNMEEKGILRRL